MEIIEKKLDKGLFKEKLGEWWQYFEEFLEGEKMYDIYQQLKEYRRKGITIFPSSENTFKAFKECQPKDLKCMIYGSDPYAGVYYDGKEQATGIALDCSNSVEGKCQPSLIAFHEGIAHEYGIKPDFRADMKYLCEQGVLLTNRSLTTGYKRIGSHLGWWDDWQQHFLENVISAHFPGVPVLFMGKECSKLQRWLFPMANPIFILDHPSYAARTGVIWETEGVFQKINKIIHEKTGVQGITWNNKIYMEELPF